MNGQTNLIFSFRELECEAGFAGADMGQLSHELAPELLLGRQHCVESLELLLFTNEPRPYRSAGGALLRLFPLCLWQLDSILIN